MPAFLGTYEPRLDEKGRRTLPARFRDGLAEGLVITKGQEHCLYVWPVPKFERIAERAGRAPLTSEMARTFHAGACDAVPDQQGRTVVPRPLRDHADLDDESRDHVVIGANTRVESWAVHTRRGYLAEQEQSFAELLEEVLPGLL